MPRSMPAHLGRAKVLAVAALQALLLAGCAHAGGQAGNWEVPPPAPPPPAHGHVQQVLSELPQDAPPGECYARVMIPGQPVVGPPQAQGAAWILNPGPPGSPGPIWCLVPTGPAPVAMIMGPEREGWIRVLCDVDATPARVEGWQKRLHKEGYYKGAPTGRYDPATADAVGRFQSERHIRHGGYLSADTVEALEGPLPPPPPRVHAQARVHPPVASAGHGRAYASSSAAASAGGVGYAPYAAVAQQPAYSYPSYPSYPAYPQAYPAYPQTQAYPQAGYVQQGYAAQSGAGYQSQSSYASSSQGGYSYGYAAPQAMIQGYAPAYAPPPAYPYGQGYGYSQSYGYGQSYGYAQGYEAYGPRPAYAAPRSAIQGGWLTWDGKPRF